VLPQRGRHPVRCKFAGTILPFSFNSEMDFIVDPSLSENDDRYGSSSKSVKIEWLLGHGCGGLRDRRLGCLSRGLGRSLRPLPFTARIAHLRDHSQLEKDEKEAAAADGSSASALRGNHLLWSYQDPWSRRDGDSHGHARKSLCRRQRASHASTALVIVDCPNSLLLSEPPVLR